MILKNRTSAPIRKERWSLTSKARREASRNKLLEKRGIADRVESVREVDCRKNRPRARPGFVKSIRNRLRKIKNLIKVDRSGRKPALREAETGLARRENGLRLQKEEYTRLNDEVKKL